MTPDEVITRLDQFQRKLFVKTSTGVEPAAPPVLAENLLLIRGLSGQLIDHVADSDLTYRHAKAARFDKFLKEGIKKSPALDALDMEPDLVDMKISTERLKAYLKHVDGICTSIQSVLKYQAASDKNQY